MNSDRRFQRISDRLLTLLIASGTLISALLLASALPDALLHNSDILYAPSFFDDLWQGFDISGWALTPAPYFFPDFFVYGAVDALLCLFGANTATRIDIALRMTAAVFYLLNGTGFVLLLKKMRPVSYRSGFLSWTTISLVFLQLPFFTGPFLAAHVPTHHSGLLCVVLFFWALWLRGANPVDPSFLAMLRANAVRYMAAFFVLPTLISDAQLLPLVFIPAFLLAGCGFLFFENKPRHGIDAFVLFLIWMLAERIIPRIRYGLVFFPSVDGMLPLKSLIEFSPERFISVLSDHGFLIPLLLWMIAACVLYIAHTYRKGEPERGGFTVEAALLLTGATGLLAALVFHVGLSAHLPDLPPITGRYLHFLNVIVFPFVPALLALSASLFFQRPFARFQNGERGGRPSALPFQRFLSPRLIVLCISLLPFAVPVLRPDAFPVSGLLSRGEQSAAAREAQCLHEIAREHGVAGPLYGISDYWHAKRLSVFAEQIRLLPVEVEEPTKLYFWITNLSWFDDERIVYRFIVIDGLDRKTITGLYGEPVSRHRCAGMEIWWYGDDSPIRHEPARLREFARVIGIPYETGNRGEGTR